MSELDTFECIKIMASNEEEKIALLNKGDAYLRFLSNDDNMAVRIRARFRLNDQSEKLTTEETRKQRRKDEIALLVDQVTSKDFSVRIKAKILLNKMYETDA